MPDLNPIKPIKISEFLLDSPLTIKNNLHKPNSVSKITKNIRDPDNR